MILSILILSFVTLQRLAELLWARRNTRALLARGAYEVAPEHYPHIVAVHAAWLFGLWIVAWNAPVNLLWLAAFGVLQGLRIWVLVALGPRWTTRILVVPGEKLVRSGPYRYLSHPNYAVVAGEIAALPLAFGQPLFALVFTVVNGVVLYTRIKAENRALSQ
ncbi:isoprenylcysteine carboxylmethyltransferase family protein [Roseiarcaceae bacterium H3SJ34-1]|uniref:isoprenylcysteine carboxyl methyltransferase family protein n=1 Tax=Terripilifer ovatus TaxID=3032367 RepID=UPI003AB9905A|nr:isoprenylcysteine carboxylmethyltransferase family protein [Roseiarcaceae bacterium H3SJ34-1]